jgi:hypothetical protein
MKSAILILLSALLSGCIVRNVRLDPIYYHATNDSSATPAIPGAREPSRLGAWLEKNLYGPETISGQSFIGATLYYGLNGEWPRSREAIIAILKENGLSFDRVEGAEHYEIATDENGIDIIFSEPSRSSGSVRLTNPTIEKKENEPNNAVELTPASVTPPAVAGAAPLASVAHLRR